MNEIIKYFKTKQPEFLFLTIVMLLFFILKQSNYLEFLNFNVREIFFVLWIIIILVLRLSSRESLVFGIACLLLSSFFMLIKIEGWLIRLGGYTYYFFLVGLIQLLLEYLRRKRE